jgi:hypothetical protein
LTKENRTLPASLIKSLVSGFRIRLLAIVLPFFF